MVKKWLLIVAMVVGRGAAAQSVNTMDFFVGEKGVCVATNVGDEGTFNQISWETQRCPRDVMIFSKGAGVNTWGVEVFFPEQGYVQIFNDLATWDGVTQSGRVFYRDNKPRGLPWVPLTVWNWIKWSVPNYGELRGEQDLCDKPQQDVPDLPGKPFQCMANVHELPAFMYDRRPGFTKTEPTDIMALRYESIQYDMKEVYTYGRWNDPKDGKAKGLGLVAFQLYRLIDGEWYMVQGDFYRFLVACTPKIGCFVCPPAKSERALPARYPVDVPIKK